MDNEDMDNIMQKCIPGGAAAPECQMVNGVALCGWGQIVGVFKSGPCNGVMGKCTDNSGSALAPACKNELCNMMSKGGTSSQPGQQVCDSVSECAAQCPTAAEFNEKTKSVHSSGGSDNVIGKWWFWVAIVGGVVLISVAIGVVMCIMCKKEKPVVFQGMEYNQDYNNFQQPTLTTNAAPLVVSTSTD